MDKKPTSEPSPRGALPCRRHSFRPFFRYGSPILTIILSFFVLLIAFIAAITALSRSLEERAVTLYETQQKQQVANAAEALEEEFLHIRRTLKQERQTETVPLLRGMEIQPGILLLPGAPAANPLQGINPEGISPLQDSPALPWGPLLREWSGYLEDSRAFWTYRRLRSSSFSSGGPPANPRPGSRPRGPAPPPEAWGIYPLPVSTFQEGGFYLGLLRNPPLGTDLPASLYVINLSRILEKRVLPYDQLPYSSLMINDSRGTILYDREPGIIGCRLKKLHRNYPKVRELDQRMLSQARGTARYRFLRRDTGEQVEKTASWAGVSLGPYSSHRIVIGTTAPISEITAPLDGVHHFMIFSLIGLSLFILIAFLAALQIRRRAHQRIQEDLQQQVAERTRELEKLTAQKNRILSLVAHDMKGPLGSLSQLLSFVDENMDTFSRENLEEIIRELRQSSGAAFDLAVNLFHWARNQEKPMAPQLQRVEALDVLSKITQVLEQTARNKGIDLQLELTGEIFLYADPGLLETAVRNITSNALKFTPRGGRVTLSAWEEGEQAALTIQDTGVGIPPEDQAKLFQVETPLSTKGTQGESGSGLGLIVCRDFVEKMGGTLTMQSKPGEGTQFTIYMPVDAGHPE